MSTRQARLGVIQPFLISILFVLAFAIINCEHGNPADSNGKEPMEVTWQQTALDSLRIRALAANAKGDVFAATCRHQMTNIFRSSDQGATWDSLSRSCTRVLGINSRGDIFAGHIAIIRSTDNGQTWEVLSLGSGDVSCIAFNRSGDIFAGGIEHDEAIGGIFRSRDNGDTWTRMSFPDSTGGALALAVNDSGHIFAGTAYGVYRSADDGLSWTKQNSGFSDKLIVWTLTINATTGSMFAAIESDGVYRSIDNGKTWAHTGLFADFIFPIVINAKGQIFAASGSFATFMEPKGVFYSEDDGTNWQQINSGLDNLNIFSLTIDSAGYVYAGTAGSGVYRTSCSTTK